MMRTSTAISSVVLPVAFVGLAAVAAPEARNMAEATWAARWVAQRSIERAEALGEQLADAAREHGGLADAEVAAWDETPNAYAAAFEPTTHVASLLVISPKAITFAPRLALIDLPPPQA